MTRSARTDGAAIPLPGPSAPPPVLTPAYDFLIIPEQATGLDAGTGVEVTLYR